MQYSGAGGKMIDQKNQKQKISWHCPFKGPESLAIEKKSKSQVMAFDWQDKGYGI